MEVLGLRESQRRPGIAVFRPTNLFNAILSPVLLSLFDSLSFNPRLSQTGDIIDSVSFALVCAVSSPDRKAHYVPTCPIVLLTYWTL